MKTIWFHSFNEIRKKQLEFISVVLNEAVKIFSDLETQNTEENDKKSPFDQWCEKENIEESRKDNWKKEIKKFVEFTMNNFIHDDVKKLLQPEITQEDVVVQQAPTVKKLTAPTLQNMIRF